MKFLKMMFIGSLMLTNAYAQTGGITFTPLKVDILEQSYINNIVISNGSEKIKAYQAEVFNWDVKNGKNELVKTNDFTVSPMVIKINPKAKQTIRIGYKGLFEDKERSYRIVFSEIPIEKKKGVQVLTNVSIPVFVNKFDEKEDLTKHLIVEPKVVGNTMSALKFRNNGNKHIKVLGYKINQNNKEIDSHKKMLYLLSGNQNDYSLNLKIEKNKRLDLEIELQGYPNVKKQYVIK